MTARAPHATETGDSHPIFVQEDNPKIWDILQDICEDTEAWTWIKSFACSRNGHLAYIALFNHYLSASTADNIQKKVKGKLEKTKYTGQNRNFNFEKCATIHKQSRSAITKLTIKHIYPKIRDCEKVRHLVKGIQTAALVACKTQIWASPALLVATSKTALTSSKPSYPRLAEAKKTLISPQLELVEAAVGVW
jgi:hypothetical protein